MEENLNPPEDRDNNRDNWSRDNHPRDSRDNQPVSYTESYRRMNERKLREEALRGERAEREERLKRQDGFKTNHSFNSSKNNSINNIQRDNSSSIHFENARKDNASSVFGTSSKARAFESAEKTENSKFAAKAGNSPGNSPRNFNRVEREGAKMERRVERGFNTGNRSTRKIEKWIIIAYLIPVIIILIILYFNFLPFGFSDTQVINVGTPKDTSGVFYLEESPALGARQMIDGDYFRTVDGVVYAVYEPKEVLKDTNVDVRLEGENVSFVLMPSIDEVLWDYDFMKMIDNNEFEISAPQTIYSQFLDGEEVNIASIGNKAFAIKIIYNSTTQNNILTGDLSIIQNSKQIIVNYTNNKTQKQIKYNLPDFFIGKEHEIVLGYNKENVYLFVDKEFVGKNIANLASIKQVNLNRLNFTVYSNYNKMIKEIIEKDEKGCLYFDGNTRLTLQNSSDKFETGPFAVYVEWKPEVANNSQQIIGHGNWELWQNEKNVQFMVGRMYNNGPMYSIYYPVSEDFFNNKHSLLAIYNPSQNGYIELYVDEIYAGKKEFGNETIWKDYGGNDLTLGWTPHNYGNSPYYEGSICNAKFVYQKIEPPQTKEINFINNKEIIRILMMGSGELRKVKIKVKEE
jgi:hypothetical protein